MDKLISIIVPVYKVEKWLKKCVRSIQKQTYSNLEIILVNDGSPDKCPQICDKLAKKDKRIKVIHKKNGGVSVARNTGIDASTGEYICFIDSDDWIDKNFIMNAYNDAVNNDAQIVVSNLTIVSLRGKTKHKLVGETQKIDFNSKGTLFEKLRKEKHLGGAIPKLFYASLIKDNNIRFDPAIRFGEDVLFLLKSFEYCSAIFLNADAGYFYNRLVSDSAILKFYPEMLDWMKHLTRAREALVDAKGESYTNGKSYVLKAAVIDFTFVVNYIVNNKSIEEATPYIEQAYEFYNPYIEQEISKATGGILEYSDMRVLEFCKSKDFGELYSYAVTKKPKATFKRKFIRHFKGAALAIKRFWYRHIDR